MHPGSGNAAAGTLSCRRRHAGVDHDPARTPSYLLNDHAPQVRQQKIEIAPDSVTRVHIRPPAGTPALHKILARTELHERRQPRSTPSMNESERCANSSPRTEH